MNFTVCPLCGHRDVEARDHHAAHCPRCQVLINLDTSPLDYSEGGGQAVPDGAKMRWRLENAKRRFRIMAPWLNDIDVLVDIGCGSGEMLMAGKERFPLRVGFDTNRPLIEHIKRSGDGMAVQGHFDPNLLPRETDGKRKLFSLSHVLEHLADPTTLFDLVVSAMQARDLLYIEVPLFTGESFRRQGYSWSLWNAEHVVLFSLDALRFLADRAGLETLRSGTRIFARGSHSSKLRLRLLRNSPIRTLKAAISKPDYLSLADVLVADYGYMLLRR